MENEMDTNELNVERPDNINNDTGTGMREHYNENSSVDITVSESTLGLHEYRNPPPDYEECVILEYYRSHDLVSCDTQTDPIPCQCRCHSEGDVNRQEYYRNLYGEHSYTTRYTPFSCTRPIPGNGGNFGVCLNIGHEGENVPATSDTLIVHDPRSTVNSTVAGPVDQKEKEMKYGVGILIVVIIISGVIYFSVSISRKY